MPCDAFYFLLGNVPTILFTPFLWLACQLTFSCYRGCSSKCLILTTEWERPFSLLAKKCTFFFRIDTNAGSSLTCGELSIGMGKVVTWVLGSSVISESPAIACLSREAPLFFLDRESDLCCSLSPLRPWSSMWRLLGYPYNFLTKASKQHDRRLFVVAYFSFISGKMF